MACFRLYTNSNEIYEIISEYVFIQSIDRLRNFEGLHDIFLFDHGLLKLKEGVDDYYMSEEELTRRRPEWKDKLLPHLQKITTDPDYTHLHWYLIHDGRWFLTCFNQYEKVYEFYKPLQKPNISTRRISYTPIKR